MVHHMSLSNTSTMLIVIPSVPVLVHIYLTGYVDISWMDIWIPQHIIDLITNYPFVGNTVYNV